MNKLLQKEAENVPFVDQGEQLPKMDSKITAKKRELKNSIDTEVYSMEHIIVIMQAKPFWELVWNPTKNEAFWYQETILPSNLAQENENFQLNR